MAETPPPVKITERLASIDTYKKYAVYVLITIAGILLVVGGVSLWRTVFKPKATTSVGKVEAGGIVNITNKNNSRWIIPFVEGGAEARDKEKIGAFLRAGVRIEF